MQEIENCSSKSNWVPHKGEVHSSRAPRTFLEQWHIGPRYCQCCCLGKSHTSSAVSTTPAARQTATNVTCWAVLKLTFSRVLSFSYLAPNLRVQLTQHFVSFCKIQFKLPDRITIKLHRNSLVLFSELFESLHLKKTYYLKNKYFFFFNGFVLTIV